MRRDLRAFRREDEPIIGLRLLIGYRADLAADRTQAINRLRGLVIGTWSPLERALDFTNQGPLILISGYPTAASIQAAGPWELEGWLRSQHVRGAARAAAGRHVRARGEAMAAALITRLAATVLDLRRQIAETGALITERFRAHSDSPVIASMPGIGDLLGAELLMATGGTVAGFTSADHLDGYAGLAPAPNDSGKRSANLHRPQRHNRQLQRVF